MKIDMKSTLTSTGKASVEFSVKECESVEEAERTMIELETKALNRYGNLNNKIR